MRTIEKCPNLITENSSVGIVCRPNMDNISDILTKMTDFLESNDVNVRINNGTLYDMDKSYECTIESIDTDMIITIGGDGTIFYMLHRMSRRDIPILSLNGGNIGFLTECEPNEYRSILESIMKCECIIEKNINISSGINDKIFPDALNDIYITANRPVRLSTLKVRINDEIVDMGRADGILVATQVGSTAYSLSAGGSILHPDIDGLIFTPVNSPRFDMKPIVFPSDYIIEIEPINKEVPGIIVVDGQTNYDIPRNETVWMKKSDSTTNFIRKYDNYWERFNERLRPRI